MVESEGINNIYSQLILYFYLTVASDVLGVGLVFQISNKDVKK